MKKSFSVFFVILAMLCSCGRVKNEPPPAQGAKVEETAAEAAGEENAPIPDAADTGVDAAVNPASPVPHVEGNGDIILRAYHDPAFRGDVLAFFGELTGSPDVARVILSNASACDIPPALAFSLCKEESGYHPGALNHNRNDTVDRGLFQLNSASFPKLTLDDFFDPGINTRNGLSHLRWCLDTAGTEVAALAMYNAGATRVRSAGTPKSTLDYVSRILKRQHAIEELFTAEYRRVERERLVLAESAGQPEKPSLRLSLLTPLGRR